MPPSIPAVVQRPAGNRDAGLAGGGRRHRRVGVRRGDLVTIALPGSYGKPRPALIIQSDLFDEHPSMTILPVTSELRDTPLFRVVVEPDEARRRVAQGTGVRDGAL